MLSLIDNRVRYIAPRVMQLVAFIIYSGCNVHCMCVLFLKGGDSANTSRFSGASSISSDDYFGRPSQKSMFYVVVRIPVEHVWFKLLFLAC